MKLLNKSLLYLFASLFFIIGLWSIVFYFNMLDEIKESIDEGLDNYKRQIIFSAEKDHSILNKNNFEEGFFSIQEISKSKAIIQKDEYSDVMMYMQDADDKEPELEPVRMLTTAFENHGNYYELKIINSMVEEDDLVEEMVYDAIWLYLLLIICIVLINNFVLQRLWKPFYSLLHQLRDYRIGTSKSFPDVNTKTKEFIDLQNAVTILLQQNIETYEQQKQFIGNASHELQTPLAIATNKLELLIERGTLQNEDAGNIAEVMNIIERLVRLNKSLLLLTKIENKQFLNDQTVLFNEIVHQNVFDLEEMAEFKSVKISIEESSDLSIKMDSSLAGIVVSNLIRNAIFHNIENGTVTIMISKSAIKISNSGNTKSLNSQKLFTRFYKSENEQGGTGLGLAIVKAICERYCFSISYYFENNLHHFEIRFN